MLYWYGLIEELLFGTSPNLVGARAQSQSGNFNPQESIANPLSGSAALSASAGTITIGGLAHNTNLTGSLATSLGGVLYAWIQVIIGGGSPDFATAVALSGVFVNAVAGAIQAAQDAIAPFGVTATTATGTLSTTAAFSWAGAVSSTAQAATTGTSVQLTLPSVRSGDIVVLYSSNNGGPNTTVTSGNLTFSQHAQSNQAGPQFDIEAWVAIANSNLTNEVITVQQTTSAALSVYGIAIAGVNTLFPYDGSGATSGSGSDLVISTSQTNCFILAGYRMQSVSAPTAGPGWTQVGTPGNFAILEYKAVNSIQTGVHATLGTGAANEGAGIGIVLTHDNATTLQATDGGTTYYSTGYFNGTSQVPMSYAIASVTNNSIAYSQGWDDPKFFPMGSCVTFIGSTADVTRWNNLHWNTLVAPTSNTVLSVCRAGGISVIANAPELFSAGGGGLIPNNGGSLGSETVGILTQDEPTLITQVTGPISGTVPGGTVTNAIQDGRFWYTNFTNAWVTFQNLNGVASVTVMDEITTTPNGTTRHVDQQSIDFYVLNMARRASFYGATISNAYGGGTAMTMPQIAKGTHYGDFLDFQRVYQAGHFPAPMFGYVETGNAKTNVPYEIAPPEINWACWSMIIHGIRGIFFFDYEDGSAWSAGSVNQNGPSGIEGFMASNYVQTNQTASFTGSISGTTLTVSAVSAGHIQPGMQITSGVTGGPVTVLAQLTFGTEATFTGTTAYFQDDDTPMTVTGVTGSIPVPSILVDSNMPNDPVIWEQTSGTAGQAGTYHVNRQSDRVNHGPETMSCYCPGRTGTYAVSGGAGSGAMVAKQPNPVVFGPPVANTGTGTMFGQVSATCGAISSLAPVINSLFATRYLSATPLGYNFPSDTGSGTGPPQSLTFGLSTGVECMAKHYTGATYTASTGDTISAGYYIFATTRNVASDINISVTFSIASASTSVTVIGEGRSIPVVSGKFTDTFASAWTVHVYRVN